MAAMNHSEMADLDPKPGAELNLDDDSLFAELDSEVMAGDEQGGGDMDFDLDLAGDTDSAAGAGGDLELDLGAGEGAALGGEHLDLDLDLGGGEGAAGGSDAIDLGDMELDVSGGESAASAGDDLELDLGGAAAGGEVEFDLELEGEAAAAGTGAGEDMLDLAVGGGEAAGSAADEIDLSDLELEGAGGEAMTGKAMASKAMASDDIVREDMEALDLDLGDESLDTLDLGAVDAGLEDLEVGGEPEPAPAMAAAEEDLGLGELEVESLEMPEEPVFDMGAPAAAQAAPAEPEMEFHAAEDIQLDEEEPLHLELDEVQMEPLEEALELPPGAAAALDSFDFGEEAPIALEPEMQAGPALEFETQAAAAPQAAQEFIAVQDVRVDDDTLLELNLDEVEAGQIAQEAELSMAQQQVRVAPAMEETIPLTEQLEIPPEVQARRAAAPMTAVRGAQAPGARVLDNEILMAVSHQISVQLGSLSLNGRELLDIGYGSVLPLDRMIGEPVDLVLDNKTIAQGEVVLINGKNLGVRIVALNKQ